jgi:dTDP-glucose 4,6-dehydratase
MKILVTGGRGFIGSHFVEEALKKKWTIVDVDKLTYASNKSLPWDNHKNYTFLKADISEIDHLPSCDVIVNFAAESHVDNSIKSSDIFVKSNILGVHNLLELIRGKPSYDRPLFFHISTDEVYGDRVEGKFTEEDKLKPSNPYSSTKAAAEMLVMSYARTYGIEYLITRSSNNYGERQFEEKLIPKCIQCIETEKHIPIHGDGSYIRDWTYVKDNVSAILLLIEKGIKNDIFNIAAENYLTNLEVAKEVLRWHGKDESNIKFVENRWGQDLRYAVSSEKIKKIIGWKPKFEQGLYKFIGEK